MLNQKLTGQQAADKTYIEDVFSTYLYTGNGSTQTINNGIDLAGKGGMVWLKARSSATLNLLLTSTFPGKYLTSNDVNSLGNATGWSLNSDGFTLPSTGSLNGAGTTYASWTFRKAPKFFDVVTFTTSSGGSAVNVNHSLNTTPGMIFFKRLNGSENWYVWHRSLSSGTGLWLNTTDAALSNINVTATSTTFTAPGAFWGSEPYVAYLFAHDTTTDGLIQCGTFSGTSTVNLGWEPQYVLFKDTAGGEWFIHDSMRGMPVSGNQAELFANQSWAEASSIRLISPTATGFNTDNVGGGTYIYMAIRRGPMRTPTDGTKVFQPVTRSGTGSATIVNTTITTDLSIIKNRSSGSTNTFFTDRLRDNFYLSSQSTNAESASTLLYPAQMWDNQSGFDVGSNVSVNASTSTYINYAFRRAPGFFDVVCYTGTGVARTVNHNLGVAPELMIVKSRSVAGSLWATYVASNGNTKFMRLNGTGIPEDDLGTFWNSTSPTSTSFSVATDGGVNQSNATYVAYLFASCPGVSKVGSYTGNGSSQTINCGFTAGARFVLIKRTDNTGAWYVWDTARGIVAGNDPHLSLNTTAADVTTDDTIDPDSTGFIVNQVAATNVNVNAATYIYLAIA